MNYRCEVSLRRLRELLQYVPRTGEFIWLTHRKGQHPPGSVAGTLGQDGYIKIRIDGVTYQAHRLAWFYMKSEWPEHEIDHKNLDKSDNKWENLRPATHGQNMINVAGRRNGLKGAYFDKRRKQWYSNIRHDGKQIRLGDFDSELSAHLAYCEAAGKFHGEFARAA